MLGAIRDKATGWLAGIIVGALIISFAFWGISSYFGGGDVYVASVNDAKIKYQTFQRAFYSLRQQMQKAIGTNALSLEEEKLIKQQTLQKLIDTELLNQIIKDNRLRITNKKVVETIKNLAFFKGEKGFDRSKYERAVASLGMTPALFEAQLRQDMLSQQLQAGLSDSLFVLDSELKDILKLKTQTRDISYTRLDLASFIDDTSDVTEAKIKSFYKANPEKFADSEKVKIAYLELDVNDLADTVKTDEASLRAYYNNNKDNYDVAEQRSVTKLFVKTAVEDADHNLKEVTKEEKENAKKVIDSALAMVKAGKGFEEVLKRFTKEGKGALQFSENNFLPKGVLEKEVEAFVFSSDEGAISDVIETKKGFYIVKVGKIRGGPNNVYGSVADQVEHDYKQEQAESQFFELADQLTNLSYEHPDTLEVAAQAIGKDIIETDFFSRAGASDGILSKPQIIAKSFDLELINSGLNSDPIELSDNHIVVLRVLEHQNAKTKPLAEVREQVIAAIRLERAADKIKQVVDGIVKQLESGATIDDVKSNVKLEWSTVEKTKRDNVEVNRAILRSAFQTGIPKDKPVVSSNRLGNGDYSIVIVSAVYDGDIGEDEDDENLRQLTDLELRRSRGTNEWRQFLKNVRDNADIKLFKENI